MNRPLAVIAVVSVVLATGCGAGEETVDRGDLEREVQTSLTKTVGQEAPKAVCEDDLEAKVGAKTRCHMDFPENKRLGISVTVKSLDGETARFDVVADDTLGETPT